jgi:hypothetical protein
MIAGLWRTFIARFKRPVDPDPKPTLKTASPTYERDRKRTYRAKRKSAACPDVSRDRPGTVPGHVPDIPKEREEEKRERETRARIPNNWRPNEEGTRIGAEVFGAWLENKIISHRGYWRNHDPPRNVDWDAMWLVECDRCKQRQLSLPLSAKPTVIGDRNETAQGRRNSAGGSVAHYGRGRIRQVFGNEG